MSIENGACGRCQNRAFIQLTMVVFEETQQFVDASERVKLFAPRVQKTYECMACGTRYIYRESDDTWVSG